MTPNAHWFTIYTPHVVAIQVADGKTVHSAGIGIIHFQPHDFNNKPLQTVLISKVLHPSHHLSSPHFISHSIMDSKSSCRLNTSNLFEITNSGFVPPPQGTGILLM
jgi:hypothetical protein